MGSGSLLLNAKRYSKEASTVRYFGQEINASTFNLARMNMMLHGVPIENQKLHIGDTLDKDWPSDEPTDFDGVLMNPPYSQKWSGDAGLGRLSTISLRISMPPTPIQDCLSMKRNAPL